MPFPFGHLGRSDDKPAQQLHNGTADHAGPSKAQLAAKPAKPLVLGPSKAVEMAQEIHGKAEQQVESVAVRLETAAALAHDLEEKVEAAAQAEKSAKMDNHAAAKELRMAQHQRAKAASRMVGRSVPAAIRSRQMAVADRVVAVAEKNLATMAARFEKARRSTVRVKAKASEAQETRDNLQAASLTLHTKEAAVQRNLSRRISESEQAAKAITELQAKTQKLKVQQAQAVRNHQAAQKLRMAAQRQYIADDQVAAARIRKTNRSNHSTPT